MATRKKSKQVQGLKPRTAKLQLKAGADGDCRISKKALKLVIPHVEKIITTLSNSVSALLDIANKKKVTKQFLLAAIKMNSSFHCQRRLTSAVESAYEAQNKGDRQQVSVASGVRLFKQGLRSDQIISADAKVAVAQIMQVTLRNIGHDAFVIAENADRMTIQSRDIKTVFQVRTY